MFQDFERGVLMEGNIFNRELFGGLISVLFLCKNCRLMIMRLVVDG